MKKSKYEVIRVMENSKIIPVFYHSDLETVLKIAEVSYEAGVRVFEFTNRGNNAIDIFKELRNFCSKNLPDMMLGIGSIVEPYTAAQYINLGADFVVSPILNHDIAKLCNRRKILWAAGCSSLSEISQAEEWGADIVKLFPADIYGPGFIKSVLAPCPWTNIMPTGGVSLENLSEWIDAGAFCVGMGSQLISKKDVENKDYQSIERTVLKAFEIIQRK